MWAKTVSTRDRVAYTGSTFYTGTLTSGTYSQDKHNQVIVAGANVAYVNNSQDIVYYNAFNNGSPSETTWYTDATREAIRIAVNEAGNSYVIGLQNDTGLAYSSSPGLGFTISNVSTSKLPTTAGIAFIAHCNNYWFVFTTSGNRVLRSDGSTPTDANTTFLGTNNIGSNFQFASHMFYSAEKNKYFVLLNLSTYQTEVWSSTDCLTWTKTATLIGLVIDAVWTKDKISDGLGMVVTYYDYYMSKTFMRRSYDGVTWHNADHLILNSDSFAIQRIDTNESVYVASVHPDLSSVVVQTLTSYGNSSTTPVANKTLTLTNQVNLTTEFQLPKIGAAISGNRGEPMYCIKAREA